MPGLLFVLILNFGLITFTFGQNTSITEKRYNVSGILTDAETNEPMMLINVTVDSLKIGTITNNDGRFNLALPNGFHKLTIKTIGYDDAFFGVTVNDADLTNLSFKIYPRNIDLETVVINPKENPANRIIRNAIKHRTKNQINNLTSYEYNKYVKVSLTANNITPYALENSLMLRPFRSFLRAKQSDSTIYDSLRNMKLTVFLSESFSKLFYKKPHSKEKIIATNATGGQSLEVSQLNSMLEQANVYDGDITLLSKEFIGPLSLGSLMNYRFYLFDTVVVGRDSIFGLQVVPRNSFDRVFQGVIYIENGSWAVKKVDLKMNIDPNINFVEGLRLRQEFTKVEDTWLPNIKDIEVDFVNLPEGFGMLARAGVYMQNFEVNKPYDPNFFDGEQLEIEEKAGQRDSTFWKKNRLSELEATDKLAFEFIDTLKKSWYWKATLIGQELVSTGKKSLGAFQLGPVAKMVNYNPVERLRLNLWANTSPDWNDRLTLGAGVGYATGDKRWKYRGDVAYIFSFKPKVVASLYYKYDIEQAGMQADGDGLDVLTTLTMRVPMTQLNYYRSTVGSLEVEVKPGLRTIYTFRRKFFEPAFQTFFTNGTQLFKTYHTNELSSTFRWSFREQFIIRNKERVYLGSRLPVFYGSYTLGKVDNPMLRHRFFHRISLALTHKLRSARFGWMNFNTSVGAVFGKVPMLSLYTYRGNQSFAFDPVGTYTDGSRALLGSSTNAFHYDVVVFNLMYFFEFVADRYVVFGFDHHFEGYLLKKIPGVHYLLHKLKVKELVSFRMALGQLSKENKALNRPTQELLATQGLQPNDIPPIQAPDVRPYMEISAGLDNILRFIRLEYVFRLSYQNPVLPTPLRGHNFNRGLMFNVAVSF